MSQAIPAGTKWWSGGKSPYNVEYGKLMMWFFLMSDAFTFGAFLISYGAIRFASNGISSGLMRSNVLLVMKITGTTSSFSESECVRW